MCNTDLYTEIGLVQYACGIEQRKVEKTKIVEQRKEVKKEIRMVEKIQNYWQLVILVLFGLGLWLYFNRKVPKKRRWHGIDP